MLKVTPSLCLLWGYSVVTPWLLRGYSVFAPCLLRVYSIPTPNQSGYYFVNKDSLTLECWYVIRLGFSLQDLTLALWL